MDSQSLRKLPKKEQEGGRADLILHCLLEFLQIQEDSLYTGVWGMPICFGFVSSLVLKYQTIWGRISAQFVWVAVCSASFILSSPVFYLLWLSINRHQSAIFLSAWDCRLLLTWLRMPPTDNEAALIFIFPHAEECLEINYNVQIW